VDGFPAVALAPAWEDAQLPQKNSCYPPGAVLPSTKALCEKLGGVNHLTVRQSLGLLAKKGLVFTVKGKGTFVPRKSDIQAPSTLGSIGFVCSGL
jgi:DNA-binding GntR family transcriptional regulator